MGRPQSRDELLDASEASFAKLMSLVDSLSDEQQLAEFAFEDRDRNVRDVLVHLHEWHLLLLAWVHSNLAGKTAPFLPAGYTWSNYAGLNVEFRDRHSETTLDQARQLVATSRAAVRAVIGERTDEELFTKKHYPWTGTTSLGAYCISATSSHDEWAMKKIRKHAKGAPA
ncbi:ClbS/DfsB family four-helix bundle protein [Demequina sp. TTPB684]|uniref:ClbS/DfsB family four-helix bundle protein n=1 Tax=unclassified Demequina TaxID=2620311 RepID=UPI001CF3C12C|nr:MULTISPECIES: ClbS/DfsB family four-helix bundle protein [unclassified Demequina]MCB2412779.1 ClbS/DfsB family four-helix bundle protein [Demequina sp. TTPB684]UPU87126.1 ClbS/DfsB family four-helix bundle protein [Demequina sp. TMPB413]